MMMAKKEAKQTSDPSSPTTDSAAEQPTPTTEAAAEASSDPAPDPAEAALEAEAESGKKDELQEFIDDDSGAELDLDEPVEEAPVKEAAKEAETPQEETPPEEPTPEGEKATPAETPPVEEPPPVAAPPAEEPPAETPTAPVPTQPPSLTVEEIQQQYQAWRSEQEAQLAQHHYAIDEETAKRLDEEPGVAIPQLMARVHVDSMVSALGYVANQLPAMIDRALALRETRSSDVDKFYERWPGLNSEEHGEAIKLLGGSYRQVNPGATPEQFIRDVGAQAMVAFGLALGDAPIVEAPEIPATKPFAPANASPPSGGPAPRQTGFAAVDDELFGQGDDLDLD